MSPAAGNNLVCISGTWQYPAYQFGATLAACNSTNAGTTQWTGSALQYCNGTSWTAIASGVAGTGTTNYVARWTSGTALGIGTLYDNGSAVGIGTPAPNRPLEVSASSSGGIGGALRITNPQTGTGTESILEFFNTTSGTTVTAAAATIAAIRQGVTNINALVFSTNNAGSVAEAMRISGAGNVGIGTTSPTNLLSLGGLTARTIWMERGASTGNNLTLQAGGGLAGGSNEAGGNLILSSGITTGIGTSQIQFQTYPVGSSGTADNTPITAMTITSAGMVGIGTTSPHAVLQVNGGAIVGNDAASCSSTNLGEVIWTGTYFQVCSNGSAWTNLNAHDIAVFMPGPPNASMIVRVVSARNATYPSGLTGSYCVAKTGATSSAVITLNKIHGATVTSGVGTATFAAGGSANQTCTFTAASAITLAPGDALEFVFPATPDATLADVAITLAGTYQ